MGFNMTGKRGISALARRCAQGLRMMLFLRQPPPTWKVIISRPQGTPESEPQLNARSNFARVSQGHARDDNSRQHHYDTTAGSCAYVYVLDSGIDISHTEFSGRAMYGANFIPGEPDCDETGHGTRMASIIGGETYGVVKNCTMISVKVINKNNESTMPYIAEAIQWVIQDAAARSVSDRSVINISITGLYDASVNEAVDKATDAGITVVVSAGNKAASACGYSPASAITAITVAASDPGCCRWSSSNYGPSVDIFAPGVGVPVALWPDDNGPEYTRGTSAAAAYVSGLAAYFISSKNLRGCKAVRRHILDASLKGIVKDTRGSGNRLACKSAWRSLLSLKRL